MHEPIDGRTTVESGKYSKVILNISSEHGQDAGTKKKARGAENFKKAHCNYFEIKPCFIDAQ